MAITGSGKYVKIQGGVMSLGVDNTAYCSFAPYRYHVAQDEDIDGLQVSTLNYLELSGLNELSVGEFQGYTGRVKVYTQYYNPYDLLIVDPDYDYSVVTNNCHYVYFTFNHGFLTGVGT